MKRINIHSSLKKLSFERKEWKRRYGLKEVFFGLLLILKREVEDLEETDGRIFLKGQEGMGAGINIRH